MCFQQQGRPPSPGGAEVCAARCALLCTQGHCVCAEHSLLLASTFQKRARRSTARLSSCFLELSLAVIFGEGRGQGNWVGWQMALNRKGVSVCLQTRRGVVPLLPGTPTKSVWELSASSRSPTTPQQMNRCQPRSRSLP